MEDGELSEDQGRKQAPKLESSGDRGRGPPSSGNGNGGGRGRGGYGHNRPYNSGGDRGAPGQSPRSSSGGYHNNKSNHHAQQHQHYGGGRGGNNNNSHHNYGGSPRQDSRDYGDNNNRGNRDQGGSHRNTKDQSPAVHKEAVSPRVDVSSKMNVEPSSQAKPAVEIANAVSVHTASTASVPTPLIRIATDGETPTDASFFDMNDDSPVTNGNNHDNNPSVESVDAGSAESVATSSSSKSASTTREKKERTNNNSNSDAATPIVPLKKANSKAKESKPVLVHTPSLAQSLLGNKDKNKLGASNQAEPLLGLGNLDDLDNLDLEDPALVPVPPLSRNASLQSESGSVVSGVSASEGVGQSVGDTTPRGDSSRKRAKWGGGASRAPAPAPAPEPEPEKVKDVIKEESESTELEPDTASATNTIAEKVLGGAASGIKVETSETDAAVESQVSSNTNTKMETDSPVKVEGKSEQAEKAEKSNSKKRKIDSVEAATSKASASEKSDKDKQGSKAEGSTKKKTPTKSPSKKRGKESDVLKQDLLGAGIHDEGLLTTKRSSPRVQIEDPSEPTAVERDAIRKKKEEDAVMELLDGDAKVKEEEVKSRAATTTERKKVRDHRESTGTSPRNSVRAQTSTQTPHDKDKDKDKSRHPNQYTKSTGSTGRRRESGGGGGRDSLDPASDRQHSLGGTGTEGGSSSKGSRGKGNKNAPVKLTEMEKRQRKRVELGEVFSSQNELKTAFHAVRAMVELQQQASEGVCDAFKIVQPETAPPVLGYETLPLPLSSEITEVLDLIEGSREFLWSALVDVRRKQLLLEGIIKPKRSAKADDILKSMGMDVVEGRESEGGTESGPVEGENASKSGKGVAGGDVELLKALEEQRKLTKVGAFGAAVEQVELLKRNAEKYRFVYLPLSRGIQAHNLLRVTESHIYSTLISHQGMRPISGPANAENGEPAPVLSKHVSAESALGLPKKASRDRTLSMDIPAPLLNTENAEHDQLSLVDRLQLATKTTAPKFSAPEDNIYYVETATKLQERRRLMAVAIRRKKLSTHQAWEELGDRYLEIDHKWKAHIADIEWQEEQAEASGPRLRGSYSGLRAGSAMGTSFERRERPDAFKGLIEPTSRISRRSTEELKAEISTTDEFGMPVKSPAMEMASLAAAQNITATGGGGSPRGRGELAQLQATAGASGGGLGLLVGLTEQDKLLSDLLKKETMALRIERGASNVPDMVNPWQWPDVQRAPSVPKWPEELRAFDLDVGAKRKIVQEEQQAKKDAREKEEEQLRRERESEEEEEQEQGGEEQEKGEDETEMQVDGDGEGEENGKDTTASSTLSVKKGKDKDIEKEKDKEMEKVEEEPKKPYVDRSPCPFPGYQKMPSEIRDTSGNRHTTDGRKQHCAQCDINAICPPSCNCMRSVDNKLRYSRVWSDLEKGIFVDKFVQYPKNFHKIASFLKNRNTKDCIKFYYDSKTKINYKSLLKEHDSRRRQIRVSWTQALAASASVGSTLYPLNSFLERSMRQSINAKGEVGFDAEMTEEQTELLHQTSHIALTEISGDDCSYHSFFNHPPFNPNALQVQETPKIWDEKLRPNPRSGTVLNAMRALQTLRDGPQKTPVLPFPVEANTPKDGQKDKDKDKKKDQKSASSPRTSASSSSTPVSKSEQRTPATTSANMLSSASVSASAAKSASYIHSTYIKGVGDRAGSASTDPGVHGNEGVEFEFSEGSPLTYQILQQGYHIPAVHETSRALLKSAANFVTSDPFPQLKGIRQPDPFQHGQLGEHRRMQINYYADNGNDNGNTHDGQYSYSSSTPSASTPGHPNSTFTGAGTGSMTRQDSTGSEMSIAGSRDHSRPLSAVQGTPPVYAAAPIMAVPAPSSRSTVAVAAASKEMKELDASAVSGERNGSSTRRSSPTKALSQSHSPTKSTASVAAPASGVNTSKSARAAASSEGNEGNAGATKRTLEMMETPSEDQDQEPLVKEKSEEPPLKDARMEVDVKKETEAKETKKTTKKSKETKETKKAENTTEETGSPVVPKVEKAQAPTEIESGEQVVEDVDIGPTSGLLPVKSELEHDANSNSGAASGEINL